MNTKRQRLRRGILLVSLLLFPLTMNYFSPVVIIMGAIQGIVVASLLVFGLQFLSALVLGRAFCGWLCPGAGFQEACMLAQPKPVKTGKADLVKWIIWIPWLITIIFLFARAGGIHAIRPLYQFENGISVSEPLAYIPYYFVVGLIVTPSLIHGRRAFCHSICWMAPFMILGRTIRNALRWPSLHLPSDQERSVHSAIGLALP